MAESCPTVEVLADLAALPADDPRRRHVQDCPRCRARLLDYQDFLAGGAPVSAASLEDALDRLDAALRDATADPGPAPALPRREALPLRPVWRATLALAAVLLLAVAVTPLLRDALDRGGPRELRLRGQTPTVALALQPARWTADGALVLGWSPVPGADAYTVHLLDAALNPLGARDAGAGTQLTLDAAALRALLPDGGDFMVWQVEALSGGDPLAMSPPESLVLPVPSNPSRE